MGLAETAVLAVELKLGTQGSFAGATSQMAGVEAAALRGTSATGLLGRGFSSAKSAAASFGGALSHAKGQLVGLLTGPLGMLGLGAGLLSIGGLFKSGIDKARDFGGEVKRLAALTGLSYETTSKLAGAFDHFGISSELAAKAAGMAEKNIFALTTTVTKHGKAFSNAAAFQRKYGLGLVDSSGHVKDFNTLLLDSADFWNNKAIPAQTKAAALNKLYGRSWQDLIPILGAGRAGIAAAEEEAARLGLTITKDNIDALSKAKEATRTWGDALGGLKLQIGLAVLPVLTDFTKGLTVLVVNNRDRIVGFVKDVASGAKALASAFGSYVLPAFKSIAGIVGTMFNAAGGISFSSILQDSANFAKDLGNALNSFVVPGVKAIVGAWDGLPAGLRELIIKGFIANKVIKWTFGFDVIGLGKGLLVDAFKGIRGIFDRGTPANPMWVAQVGGGGGPGIPGAAAAAGAAPVAAIAAGFAAIFGLPIVASYLAENNIAGFHRGNVPSRAGAIGGAPMPTFGGGLTGNAPGSGPGIAQWERANAAAEMNARRIEAAENRTTVATGKVAHAVDALHRQFRADLAALRHATKPLDIQKFAKAIQREVQHGVGSAAGTKAVLADLTTKLTQTDDPKTRAVLNAAIRAVQAKLPNREFVQQQLDAAKKIAASSESSKKKLADLEAIQKTLKAHGDTNAAKVVAGLKTAATKIDAAKAKATADTNSEKVGITAAIKAQKLAVTIPITNNISVSNRDIIKTQTTFRKAGGFVAT